MREIEEEPTVDCLDEERALAFVANQLGDAQVEAVEQHLADCSTCMALVRDTEDLCDTFSLVVADEETDVVVAKLETVLAADLAEEATADHQSSGVAPSAVSGIQRFLEWLNAPIELINGWRLPRIALLMAPLLVFFLIPRSEIVQIENPIADQAGNIGLSKDGVLVTEWDEPLSPEVTGWVTSFLLGNTIELAASSQALKESLADRSAYLGAGDPQGSVPIPDYPNSTLVKGLPFEFRWQGGANMSDYDLEILPPQGETFVHRVVGVTRVSTTDLGFTFEPGVTYRWRLEGVTDADSPDLLISDTVSFGLLGRESASVVSRIEAEHGNSLLIRTVTYLRFGLEADAAAAFAELEALNPESAALVGLKSEFELGP